MDRKRFNRTPPHPPQLKGKLKDAVDYMASKMQNIDRSHPNPIDTLGVDDISYLQQYLQHVKMDKIYQSSQPQLRSKRATDIYDPLDREVPVDWREIRKSCQPCQERRIQPGPRGTEPTRLGKKLTNNDDPDNYYNPYEYGARQNTLPPARRPRYNASDDDPRMLDHMGLDTDMYNEKFPGYIRNVNVESSLLQSEPTHLPGQRQISQKEMDRFELLPFDPQDHTHIVWDDNMPRGGYATRANRLEN